MSDKTSKLPLHCLAHKNYYDFYVLVLKAIYNLTGLHLQPLSQYQGKV